VQKLLLSLSEKGGQTMAFWKCPGQDPTFWKPEDIFETLCPYCSHSIEFWKNDVTRPCPGCKQQVANPRFNPGCAAWCEYADKCLGEMAKTIKNQPQIIRDRLKANLRKKLNPQERELFNNALKAAQKAESAALNEKTDPLIPIVINMIGPIACIKSWSKEDIMTLLEESGIEGETADRIYKELVKYTSES